MVTSVTKRRPRWRWVLLLAVGLGMLVSAAQKIQHYGHTPPVHVAALWVALAALLAKELLFRYMLRIAERVRSSMLVANAWHARSDAAFWWWRWASSATWLASPARSGGGSVGLMVVRTGWGFFWSALHDLMDRAVSAEEAEAIRTTILATPGVGCMTCVRGAWAI
jgi:divalent metal cation (Fe/Co/Zn/Cd) transporter